MIVYLASPGSQLQANVLEEMSVLISFASWSDWMEKYQQIFQSILIDSGAFSELNSKVKIDGEAYKDWCLKWEGRADAIAGLDDISGDWKRSLKNYELYGGFPTIHEADPIDLIDDLIPISRDRGNWIGVGLTPPRAGKEALVRRMCERIPEDLHVHGWACREYTYISRIDSVDSTNWWRDGMRIRKVLPWLTYGEALDIVVKRYQRESRMIFEEKVGGFL